MANANREASVSERIRVHIVRTLQISYFERYINTLNSVHNFINHQKLAMEAERNTS